MEKSETKGKILVEKKFLDSLESFLFSNETYFPMFKTKLLDVKDSQEKLLTIPEK